MGKLKLEKLGNKEYKIDKTRILFLEENIIYVEPHGAQTDDIAKQLFQIYLKHNIISSVPRKYLINLNYSGKNSSEARKIWKKIGEMESTLKVGYFGLHPVAKVLASFVIGVSKKKNSRFFFNKEEAINWLKL